MAKSNITTTIETITPEIARKYLEHNTSNRNLRLPHVDMLSREMKEGRWVVNGQGPIFASNGRLVNGQHTLSAIVRSGCTVQVLVTRGVDEGAYRTLDQGARRTSGDDLRSLGVPDANQIAAATRLILLWTRGAGGKDMVTIAKTEIVQYALEHPSIGDITRSLGAVRTLKIPRSAVIAVGTLACQDGVQKQKWSDFTEGLGSGANLQKGSPILILRNLSTSLRSGAGFTNEAWFAHIARAWNSYSFAETKRSIRGTDWPDKIVGSTVDRVSILKAKAAARQQRLLESGQALGALARAKSDGGQDAGSAPQAFERILTEA